MGSATSPGPLLDILLGNFSRIMLFISHTIRIQMDLFILGYAIGVFNYTIYYTICEKTFRGYTLGKLITGTRAIRDDGTELTFKDALLRSLSRLVPLELLSGFAFRPWHDSWTKTQVIRAR